MAGPSSQDEHRNQNLPASGAPQYWPQPPQYWPQYGTPQAGPPQSGPEYAPPQPGVSPQQPQYWGQSYGGYRYQQGSIQWPATSGSERAGPVMGGYGQVPYGQNPYGQYPYGAPGFAPSATGRRSTLGAILFMMVSVLGLVTAKAASPTWIRASGNGTETTGSGFDPALDHVGWGTLIVGFVACVIAAYAISRRRRKNVEAVAGGAAAVAGTIVVVLAGFAFSKVDDARHQVQSAHSLLGDYSSQMPVDVSSGAAVSVTLISGLLMMIVGTAAAIAGLVADRSR